MKSVVLVLFILLIFSCKEKIITVTSIDQVPGIWQWESTFGGVLYGYKYSSKSEYATIEFASDGKYIEKHNDTIFLQTKYSIIKYDDTFGTLVFENSDVSRPLSVIHNRLLIDRGDLQDTYYKIK